MADYVDDKTIPESPARNDTMGEALDLETVDPDTGVLVIGAQGKGDGAQDDNRALKTTKDGQFILVPQPPDDPSHPLNWSWWRKHRMLAVLTYCTLMADFTSAWTIPLVLPQAEYWNITPDNAGRNLSGNIFMIGMGGLFAVPLTRRLGRLPVLFWAMTLAFILTIAATATPGWISYIVIRCLQGFFITSPQVTGLSVIHDMFFFHEHARKIGIWGWSFVFSPFLAPFLSGIIVNYTTWRNSSWVNVGLMAIAVILLILWGEETDHRDYDEAAPTTWARVISRIKRLTGVTGWKAQHRGAMETVHSLVNIFTRPHYLMLLVYYLLTFMWSIGMNVTLTLFFAPPPPVGYGFSNLTMALFYISPMLACVLGEIWGHWFNDFIFSRSIKTSGGMYKAEVRLWMLYISTAFQIGGLVFYGYALERHMAWIAAIVAWGMYGFGIITQTVALSAYAIDIFPEHAVEASAALNVFRVSGGFIVNYFLVKWATTAGPIISFGCQAGIVGAAFMLVLVVQVWGTKLRVRFPGPRKDPRHIA